MAIHDAHDEHRRRKTPEEQMARTCQLARKSELKPFDFDQMMSHVPRDWQPGEWDVDEFLATIRRPEDAAR